MWKEAPDKKKSNAKQMNGLYFHIELRIIALQYIRWAKLNSLKAVYELKIVGKRKNHNANILIWNLIAYNSYRMLLSLNLAQIL